MIRRRHQARILTACNVELQHKRLLVPVGLERPLWAVLRSIALGQYVNTVDTDETHKLQLLGLLEFNWVTEKGWRWQLSQAGYHTLKTGRLR